DADYWHGEFLGLDLSYAESLGIQPVVYFNENRDAVLPSFSAPETPESCLTTTNGWYEASVFLQNHDASDVKAFAVDLRTSENGDFALSADTVDAVSIEVHMKGVFTEQTDGGVWAYNNPAYTSQQNGLLKTREGNSVRVRMEQNGSFIVEKHVTNAPNSMKNVSFNFQLKLAGTDDYYAYQTYTLQELVNGDWVSQTGRIYSTDAQGKLQLKDNQRAVFSNAENLTVEELGTGIIWKSAKTTTTEKLNDKDTQVTNVFTNEWVPLLYLEKEIKGFAVEPQNKTFTFMVETSEDGLNWTPLANAPYWVVKENFAGTTLNPPVVSEGVTKADGTLTLTAGEIAAVAPGHSGIRYRVTEQTASTPDWICKSDTETGTLGNLGSTEKFTNYYKYKELRITKNLTHQDPADCTQAFTFTLYTVGDDGTLTPVSEALNWSLEDGSAAGTLKNGSFTVACAGKTVVVSGLTAGQKYCIKETDTGDNYAAEKAGGVTFTVYPESSGKNVTVTNDYLLRDLSVTKQVVGKGSVSKAFTMTLEKKDASGTWQPVANQGYTYAGPYSGGSDTTGADGAFTLSAGFTATFKNLDKEGAEYRVTETYDSDYPQISPASSGG
ncbi:MAG: hypothetical protein HUJ67_04430, partial [Ruminiclostridium sp.]|nr:hypothetical protein [Ruminiclostridium sp.]